MADRPGFNPYHEFQLVTESEPRSADNSRQTLRNRRKGNSDAQDRLRDRRQATEQQRLPSKGSRIQRWSGHMKPAADLTDKELAKRGLDFASYLLSFYADFLEKLKAANKKGYPGASSKHKANSLAPNLRPSVLESLSPIALFAGLDACLDFIQEYKADRVSHDRGAPGVSVKYWQVMTERLLFAIKVRNAIEQEMVKRKQAKSKSKSSMPPVELDSGPSPSAQHSPKNQQIQQPAEVERTTASEDEGSLGAFQLRSRPSPTPPVVYDNNIAFHSNNALHPGIPSMPHPNDQQIMGRLPIAEYYTPDPPQHPLHLPLHYSQYYSAQNPPQSPYQHTNAALPLYHNSTQSSTDYNPRLFDNERYQSLGLARKKYRKLKGWQAYHDMMSSRIGLETRQP